jgi:cytochrome c553
MMPHARPVAVIAAALAIAPVLANAQGDAAIGKRLADKDCNGCHVRQFGSVERIYVRPDRRVSTVAQLKAQVAYCNTQLGTHYFPDEEEHVVAWLNQQYYHFKP